MLFRRYKKWELEGFEQAAIDAPYLHLLPSSMEEPSQVQRKLDEATSKGVNMIRVAYTYRHRKTMLEDLFDDKTDKDPKDLAKMKELKFLRQFFSFCMLSGYSQKEAKLRAEFVKNHKAFFASYYSHSENKALVLAYIIQAHRINISYDIIGKDGTGDEADLQPTFYNTVFLYQLSPELAQTYYSKAMALYHKTASDSTFSCMAAKLFNIVSYRHFPNNLVLKKLCARDMPFAARALQISLQLSNEKAVQIEMARRYVLDIHNYYMADPRHLKLSDDAKFRHLIRTTSSMKPIVKNNAALETCIKHRPYLLVTAYTYTFDKHPEKRPLIRKALLAFLKKNPLYIYAFNLGEELIINRRFSCVFSLMAEEDPDFLQKIFKIQKSLTDPKQQYLSHRTIKDNYWFATNAPIRYINLTRLLLSNDIPLNPGFKLKSIAIESFIEGMFFVNKFDSLLGAFKADFQFNFDYDTASAKTRISRTLTLLATSIHYEPNAQSTKNIARSKASYRCLAILQVLREKYRSYINANKEKLPGKNIQSLFGNINPATFAIDETKLQKRFKKISLEDLPRLITERLHANIFMQKCRAIYHLASHGNVLTDKQVQGPINSLTLTGLKPALQLFDLVTLAMMRWEPKPMQWLSEIQQPIKRENEERVTKRRRAIEPLPSSMQLIIDYALAHHRKEAVEAHPAIAPIVPSENIFYRSDAETSSDSGSRAAAGAGADTDIVKEDKMLLSG